MGILVTDIKTFLFEFAFCYVLCYPYCLRIWVMTGNLFPGEQYYDPGFE